VQAAHQHAVRAVAAAAGAAQLQLLQQAVPGTRDAAPLPPEQASAAGFSETKVQALMQGVGIGRQAALDAMKRAGGDAALAFRHELARVQLCWEVVDRLAWEYAAYRWVGGGGKGGGAVGRAGST
jgi:hypothetical protein